MSRLSEDIAASLRAGVCSDSVVVPRPCRSPSELSNASQVQTPQRRQSLRPSEPSLAPPQISGASTSARKIPSVRLSSNNSISRGDKEPGQVEEVHFTKPKYPHTGRRRQKLLRRFGKLLGIDVDVTPRAHHATEIGKSDRPGTSESSTKGNVTSVSVAKLDNGNLQTGAKDLQTQPSPIEEQSEEEALSRSPTRTNSMDEEVEKHSEVDKSTKEVHNSTTSANAAKARFCRRRRKTNDALEALICRCSETCLCRKYVGCLDNSIASDRATASSRKLSEDVPSLVSSRSESDVSTNALIRMRRHLLEGVGGVLSPQGRGLRDSPESSQSDRSGHARRAAGPLTYTQSSNDSRRTGVHESSHSDSIESVMRSATVGARNTE
ncbi:MAG: hypothetical protein M1828_001257 [Chrysothrix sp. TS-e1954]|nr:MAG: hypothetical protein M1828_001257 [Chrysothrix sp. TS-e1954]